MTFARCFAGLFVLLLSIAALSPAATAGGFAFGCTRDWYVATDGSDENSGRSPDEAFRTLGQASWNPDLQPGDCVEVAPGTYNEWFEIRRGGSAEGGYVVFKSAEPLAAKIAVPASAPYRAVFIDTNYVVLDGFEITQESTANQGPCVDSVNPDRIGRHHIVIQNNLIHDCGGSGISLAYGDYYWVVGNIAHSNAATNGFQMSGISIYEPGAVSGSESGFHIVVDSNIVHHNAVTFACTDPNWQRCHTDGNGIIIDDFRHTQSPGAPYPFATLVSNNLVYLNGGRGIHVFLSENVSILNNTAFSNNQDPLGEGDWRGEINLFQANHNRVANNVLYAVPTESHPNNAAIIDSSCCGAVNQGNAYSHNLTFVGGLAGDSGVKLEGSPVASVTFEPGHLLGRDPAFVSTTAPFDFRLRPDSPAIRAGDPAYTPPLDLTGAARTTPVDLGAYAFP